MKKTFFNHDSNARNDIRIIKLRAKLGYEGYGVFWAVLELLFTEENKLCVEDYETLSYGLQCDSNILKQVIEDFDLFVLEGNCFYSRRLYDHIEEINNKSQKAKESASKRWNKQPQSDRSASISISNSKSKSKVNNIKERVVAFKNAINQIENIDKEDKDNFFMYWSELNKSGSKQRWELEKTWDLSRRIKRWANSSFNKKQSNFPDNFNEFTYKKLDQAQKKEYENHLKALGWTCVYSPNAGMVWKKPKL
jgi:hypothetical protein